MIDSKLIARSFLALAVTASPGPATAGLAFLRSANDAQWVMAASSDRLDALIERWRQAKGSITVRIKCYGTGWAALFYDQESRATGVSCGFDSRREAERAALSECRSGGGADCRRVKSGFDEGAYTDTKFSNGLLHLGDMEED